MSPQGPSQSSRFRVARWLGVVAIVLGLVAAAGSLAEGAPERALLPLSTVGFTLWWLWRLPREDPS